MEDGRTVLPQKDGRGKTRRSAPFGAKKTVFSLAISFHGVARKNRPAIPPLNIDIILCRRLGHTVLIFQAGSHFWVQSRMPVPDTVLDPVVRRG